VSDEATDAWLQEMQDTPPPRVDPEVWAQIDADAAEAQALLERATQLDESGDRQEAAQLRERATAMLAANDKARDYWLKVGKGWQPNADGELRPPRSGAAEDGAPMKGAPSMNDVVRQIYENRGRGS
jgi:hypothetical protein